MASFVCACRDMFALTLTERNAPLSLSSYRTLRASSLSLSLTICPSAFVLLFGLGKLLLSLLFSRRERTRTPGRWHFVGFWPSEFLAEITVYYSLADMHKSNLRNPPFQPSQLSVPAKGEKGKESESDAFSRAFVAHK